MSTKYLSINLLISLRPYVRVSGRFVTQIITARHPIFEIAAVRVSELGFVLVRFRLCFGAHYYIYIYNGYVRKKLTLLDSGRSERASVKIRSRI